MRSTAPLLPPDGRMASAGRGEGAGAGTPGGTMVKLSVTVTLASPVEVGTGGTRVGGRTGSSLSLPSMTAA